MKRESIIRGLAKWAAKEIKPRLPAFSPARIALATFEQLAVAAPAAAEAVAASLLGPVVPAVVNAAGPQFDAVADALVAAAKSEEKMVLYLAGIPYSLTETDFRNIVNEIRTQEASAA
jgi:hypothetical protein